MLFFFLAYAAAFVHPIVTDGRYFVDSVTNEPVCNH